MPLRKDLSKEMIIMAQKNTRSNRAAARYLNCSFNHYKRWAKLYDSDIPGVSLFDKHTNRSGKGIPKFMKGKGGDIDSFPILDIIEGRLSCDHFTPNTIKDAMIREGLLREQCCECGFNDRRMLDFKMPLLMYFIDKNKRNYRPENIKLMCYNCYFLLIEDIFTPKQELAIQDHKSVYMGRFDWELDPESENKLKEANIDKTEFKVRDKNDGMEFVSRL